jgi:hypothetical protein
MSIKRVTTRAIDDSQITADKIAVSAVTEAKILNGAVSLDKLAANAVDESKIAESAVTAGKIADGAVSLSKLAADSVNADKIADGAVTSAKLATDAVTDTKIAAGAVTNTKLATDAVTDTKIAASAVITTKIADANITAAKLSGAQTGAAPIYGARAWVNFNGTGTVAIVASANVTSITDNGAGDYTVNFTTAMPDANFAIGGAASRSAAGTRGTLLELSPTSPKTTTSCRVRTVTVDTSPAPVDSNIVDVIVIR